jgi:ribonuclease Z
MSMTLAILGSGSAVPDPVRGNPSQAVTIDQTTLLFDCGERTTVNLVSAGINPLDVDALFFTHLHWDHISDFGFFAISSWNCGRRRELPIFGPPGTAAMVEASLYGVHRCDVEYLQRYVRALPDHITDRPSVDPPFRVHEMDVGWRWERDGFQVIAGAVEHHQRLGVPSIGYRIESKHGVVALSGDTAPCEEVVELARDADILVHDCAFLDEIIEAREMWSHSGPTGAGKVAAAANVKTLVLTHLGPYTSPEPSISMASMYYGEGWGPEIWEQIVRKAEAQFGGEVILGRDALVLEVGRDTDK